MIDAAGEVIDDRESERRAQEAKARNEPHFYMMEMAPGEGGGVRVRGGRERWAGCRVGEESGHGADGGHALWGWGWAGRGGMAAGVGGGVVTVRSCVAG